MPIGSMRFVIRAEYARGPRRSKRGVAPFFVGCRPFGAPRTGPRGSRGLPIVKTKREFPAAAAQRREPGVSQTRPEPGQPGEGGKAVGRPCLPCADNGRPQGMTAARRTLDRIVLVQIPPSRASASAARPAERRRCFPILVPPGGSPQLVWRTALMRWAACSILQRPMFPAPPGGGGLSRRRIPFPGEGDWT